MRGMVETPKVTRTVNPEQMERVVVVGVVVLVVLVRGSVDLVVTEAQES